MILNDNEIKAGSYITPFNESMVDPHSYNLTLSKYYRKFVGSHFDFAQDNTDKYTNLLEIDNNGLVIYPNALYLFSTEEKIHCYDCVGEVAGRSSIGRAGVMVHVTAGFIDYGFEGNITLEVGIIGNHTVQLYAGMDIAQIKLYRCAKPAKSYFETGRYNNQGHSVGSRYVFKKQQDVDF